MKNKKYARLVLALLTLTAILYNSWPLGFLLNSKTAHYGLASDLDGAGQPYYWIFILGDVLVGASLLTISFLMHQKLRREFWSRSWGAVFVGLFLFGLFTATSAASPNTCNHHLPVCASFDNRRLGPDGLESTVAALGLLVSLIGTNLLSLRFHLSQALKRSAQGALGAWVLSGLLFLLAADKNGNAHLFQQILLITSGLALVVIGLNIYAAVQQA